MRKFSLIAMLMAFVAIFTVNATDYYLIGTFNDWTTSDASCKFTDNGDGTYVLNLNTTLTSGFKVNDGTWSNPDVNFGSNGSNLVVGEPYYYVADKDSGNILMSASVENPTITLNPTEKTLLVEGEAGEAGGEGGAEEGSVVYLMGLDGDWSAGIAATVGAIEENCAVWTIDNWTAGSEFKFKDNSGWYGYTASAVENGTWYECGDTGMSNTVLPAAATGKTVTLTFAADNHNFKAEWAEEGEGGGEEGEIVVAVAGAFNNWSTNANATNEIVDNCATIVVENYQNAVEEQGEGFKFTINGAGWYGTDATIVKDEWFDSTANSVANINLPEEANGKTVTFTFAVDTYSFKVSWDNTSGINSLFGDDDSVEFYNLNGARVKNPCNGIFIVRQNGQVSKVILP